MSGPHRSAWGDVDLDAGEASVARACVYVDGQGMVLAPPKTAGVEGKHLLAPVVVELLGRRWVAQRAEQDVAGEAWRRHTYDGRDVQPVFTTATGGPRLRQGVGHANPSTTAGYVCHLGKRPKATADAVTRLLDPTIAREE